MTTGNSIVSSVVSLSLLTTTMFLVKPTHGADLKPRCGDCWCIHDGISETCPTNTTGINDSFPAGNSVYGTFQQTNEVIKLLTPDGEECFPFANTLPPSETYPESNRPQCHIPISTDETVCSYLYETNPKQTCSGRNYQIITYDSLEASNQAGAHVVHKGACGVCSTAHDLWARMRTTDTFETETAVCAASYLFNFDLENRFNDLVQCAQDAGLSEQCALLWSHLGASTISSGCGTTCQTDAETGASILNGPPPQCIEDSCLECAADWNTYFGNMSGFSPNAAGMTENLARSCDAFFPVVHEPCVDAVPSDPTPSPTSSPTTISDQQSSGIHRHHHFDDNVLTVISMTSFFWIAFTLFW